MDTPVRTLRGGRADPTGAYSPSLFAVIASSNPPDGKTSRSTEQNAIWNTIQYHPLFILNGGMLVPVRIDTTATHGHSGFEGE